MSSSPRNSTCARACPRDVAGFAVDSKLSLRPLCRTMIELQRSTRRWSTWTVNRWLGEAMVAAVFLAFAAETFAHRDFSPELHYKSATALLALGTGIVGLLPLLFHGSKRLFVVGFTLLGTIVLGLLLIGMLAAC